MNRDRAQEIIDLFTTKKILVVGDVMLDRYIHGVVERLNPEAPVPILRGMKIEEMTGGAGNVAKNVVSLGAAATAIGVVGDDDAADRLISAAQEEQYEAEFTLDDSRPTTEKVRHYVRGQQLLRVDFEESKEVSEKVEKKLLEDIEEAVALGVDSIILSDYAKGVITRGLASRLIEVANEKNIIIAADVKPSRADFITGVSFISPNKKEAFEMLGKNMLEHTDTPADSLARDLAHQFDTQVYLTMADEGILVCAEDYIQQIQGHKVAVFDESGAGDTVISVLTLALSSGATPAEAAELGNAAGATVVQKIGSVGISREELIEAVMS